MGPAGCRFSAEISDDAQPGEATLEVSISGGGRELTSIQVGRPSERTTAVAVEAKPGPLLAGEEFEAAVKVWQLGRPKIPRLKVIPDKDSYRPGDVAKLRIIAPFSGSGVITHQIEGKSISKAFQLK